MGACFPAVPHSDSKQRTARGNVGLQQFRDDVFWSPKDSTSTASRATPPIDTWHCRGSLAFCRPLRGEAERPSPQTASGQQQKNRRSGVCRVDRERRAGSREKRFSASPPNPNYTRTSRPAGIPRPQASGQQSMALTRTLTDTPGCARFRTRSSSENPQHRAQCPDLRMAGLHTLRPQG